MKKILGRAIFLLACAAALYFFQFKHTAPPATERPAGENSSGKVETPNAQSPAAASPASSAPAAAVANSDTPDSGSPQPENLAARAGKSEAQTNTADDVSPEIILQGVGRAVHQYGQMFGGNPVGTNPEITAALTGKNPKQINFLSGQPGLRINDKGELIDTWGTPYFFHQLSGMTMEIHSAGPDKVMWTSDDLVTQETQ